MTYEHLGVTAMAVPRGTCIVEFYVPTWLSPRVPRCLIKHYSDTSGRMFLSESHSWVGRLSKADCPPSVGGPHPTWWRLKENKRLSKKESLLSNCLWAGTVSSAFGVTLGPALTSRALPGLQLAVCRPGFLSLHNLVCQRLRINFFACSIDSVFLETPD